MKFLKHEPAKTGLRIIIVGCGKVGESLIKRLTQEKHDITLVESDISKIQDMQEMFDILCINGSGASFNVLKEAGVGSADLLVAVTDSDELNLLCCTVAQQVGNCSTIARVRNPEYSGEINYLRDRLGLDMIINPELTVSHEAARILSLPTALEVRAFAHGQAELVRFKIPDTVNTRIFDGVSIADLGKSGITENVLICCQERDGKIYIPSGDNVIHFGDTISVVASPVDAREFLKKAGFETRQVTDVMIIGGGKASYYLAKRLLGSGIDVKIIEKDLKRCERLDELLPNAVIINGDGTDEELLKEEGIERVQGFVPLTGIDEENVLLSLHARYVSNAKTITKIDRLNFKDAITSLDLGSVLYPKLIASEQIIAYVRAKTNSKRKNNEAGNNEVESLYKLLDDKVEVIEFHVKEESSITNLPLKELNLVDNLLVACIIRHGRITIPTGSDSIQVGDTVVIVTTNFGISDIQNIVKED